MTVGCIYYTDFHADPIILEACLQQLRRACPHEIVSVSLNYSLNLGCNIRMVGERSYPTMTKQIVAGLSALATEHVFFLEHDVLYHPSHFDFVPPIDDKYYYNINNWRWHYPHDYLINYDGLTSLSMLCCNRKLALEHYRFRLKHIEDEGLSEIRSREPRWVRRIGYEPGTKKIRRGGLTDEEHVKIKSALPNVDIRHGGTFSRPKVFLHEFRHLPNNWNEAKMAEIPGWDLKGMFGL